MLKVLDANNNQIAYNDEYDGLSNNNSQINITLPEDDHYIIEVRSYSDSSGGIYTLMIESLGIATPTPTPTPTPTSTPTASPPRIGEVGDQVSEIQVGWYERWSYAGQEGEIITIRVIADKPTNRTSPEERQEQGLFDTLVILRNSADFELTSNDDIEDGIQTNSLINEFALPANDIYEIEVRSWSDRTGGAYTMIIESQSALTPTPTLIAD